MIPSQLRQQQPLLYLSKQSSTALRPFTAPALLLLAVCSLLGSSSFAQEAVLKGRIQLATTKPKTVTGKTIEFDYPQMKARLREFVNLPAPNYPAGFEKRTQEQQTKWIQEFANSEEGKAHIERNKKLLAEANSFEIKFENNGSFVIYDVPAGRWAIQGRTDKEIDGITYAFEVFGELTVQKKVDELALAPIQVEVTPILKKGDTAPAIEVMTFDGKDKLTNRLFRGKPLLINFWSTVSPTAQQEQAMVQQAAQALKQKHKLQLLSINVDQDRKKATQFLLENQMREGSHGFSGSAQHPTVLQFGARRFPSFWLVSADGKIMMTHQEFILAMQNQPEFKTIIANRIEGKDAPTMAPKPEAKQ